MSNLAKVIAAAGPDLAAYAHPQPGSDRFVSMGDDENRAYVLFSVPARTADTTVDVTLAFTGRDGRARPEPVPGWKRRPLELRCFDERGDGSLRPAHPGDTLFVLTLSPESDLWPGETWQWSELDREVRQASTGDEDPYGFGHGFLQQVAVELRLLDGARGTR